MQLISNLNNIFEMKTPKNRRIKAYYASIWWLQSFWHLEKVLIECITVLNQSTCSTRIDYDTLLNVKNNNYKDIYVVKNFVYFYHILTLVWWSWVVLVGESRFTVTLLQYSHLVVKSDDVGFVDNISLVLVRLLRVLLFV